MSRFWHPFADMHAVDGHELVVARGDGVWVWDEEGRRYLDGTASLWCVNVGHGRREIRDAVAHQMDELATYQCFGAFANRPALELCERLADLAPVDDAKVLLGAGGGDAVDTAAKLARRYFALTGEPDRVHLVSRTQGYHGTHGHGTALGGIAPNRDGFGPQDPHTSQVPWDSVEALEAEVARVGADRVAAVFVEPVIGAGGVRLPVPGYLEGVAAVCRRIGALLVVDAVITAFGRLGEWFGPERFGVRPDLLCFAKGVTSGYLPLGGVVASGRVAAPFWDEPGAWWRHGQTYAGHPTVCAAALANLEVLDREGLVPRGYEVERLLEQELRPLESHPLVTEVRAGLGALAAVGVPAEHVPAVAAGARERGVLVRPLGDGVALSPPLTIEEAEVQLAAGAIAEALDGVLSAVG